MPRPPKSLIKGCIGKEQQWKSQISELFPWNLLPAPSPTFPFLSVSDSRTLPVTPKGKLCVVLSSISTQIPGLQVPLLLSVAHLWLFSFLYFPLFPPFWRPSYSTTALSQWSVSYCFCRSPRQWKKHPPKNISLHRLTFSVVVFGLLSPKQQKLNLLIFHQRP